jgi:hypothetical protein
VNQQCIEQGLGVFVMCKNHSFATGLADNRKKQQNFGIINFK